jgi:transposase-like protein
MGSILDANCQNCGFSTSVSTGSVWMNHMQRDIWPIFCRQCRDIQSTNTRVTPIVCEACGSADVVKYGDPQLSEPSGRELTSSWLGNGTGDTDRLPAGNHFCPQCRSMTLVFRLGIMFD